MIFLVLGGVGLAILIVSFVVDGLFDAIDFDIFDNGVLSMTGIAGFLAFFGFTGFLCQTTGQSDVVTGSAASAAGLFGLIATGTAMRYMKQQSQDDNAYNNASMVGRSAVVISGAAAGRYATVRVEWNGMSENMTAISDQDLQSGDSVKITSLLSHSSVRVEKLAVEG